MPMKRLLFNILPFVVFAIAAFAYMAIRYQDLMYVTQMQDMFRYDASYFLQMIIEPGFMLRYVGSFLGQFAFHPILGILLFVGLLTLLALLLKWGFSVSAEATSVVLIPSLLILMYVAGWDYNVFAMRHYGNLFSPIVGCLSMASLAAWYVRIGCKWMRYVWTILVIAAGYPLIGIYAFGAVVMAMLHDVFESKRFGWIMATVAVVLAVAVPFIASRYFFLKFNTLFLACAGLPYLDFGEDANIKNPLYIAIVATVLISVARILLNMLKYDRMRLIVSAALTLVVMILVPIKANSDSNFRTLLAIEHAYEDGEDDRVLDLCLQEKNPIRSIIQYRNIELFRRNQLLDHMFNYSWVSSDINCDGFCSNTWITASRVYFKYGFFNFAYRWAMERSVRYKYSNIDTKMMAAASVYNQEKVLAERYLSLLDNTLYYKDWAKDIRRLYDKELMHDDVLYQRHRQIALVPKGALDNTEMCEYMLMKHFMNLQVASEQRNDLSIANAMVAANQDVFWKLCLARYQQNPNQPLPKHVQEAALLFAFLKQNPPLYNQIKLMVGPEGEVCQQFERIQDLIVRLLTQPMDSDVNTLLSLCPGTYWSYFFYDAHQPMVFD